MSTFTVKKNIDRATQFAGDNFGKAMQNKMIRLCEKKLTFYD